MLWQLHFFSSKSVYGELKDVAKPRLNEISSATSRVAECFILSWLYFELLYCYIPSKVSMILRIIMLRLRARVFSIFCHTIRYIVLNGATTQLISCLIDTENISVVIFQVLTHSTVRFPLSAFQHIPTLTNIGCPCTRSNFLKIYESLSCHVLGICSNPHFFLSTDVYAG